MFAASLLKFWFLANPNIALLVHTCDRYAFLYPGFEAFFRKYWNFDIPCSYYFATEEKAVSIDGFVNLQSGAGAWADRLAYLLREKITEPYVLYFQEDMWLNKKVNASFFKSLFTLAQDHQWKQVKLHSSEVYTTQPTGLFIEGFQVTRLDNAQSDFLMSHQVTLWDKNFLLAQLYKNEHPWRNERKGTRRLKQLNPQIMHLDYFSENGKPAINNNQAPVGRSGYHTVSANGMLDACVQPFISELMQGNEQEQRYAQSLQHHLDQMLTHDGLPKPRKVDIFKKVKNMFRGK